MSKNIREANEALEEAIEARLKAGYPDIQRALERLKEWVPECGGGDFEPVYDDEMPENIPFFTEMYLYNLLGKEDARTILALLNSIDRAIGGLGRF